MATTKPWQTVGRMQDILANYGPEERLKFWGCEGGPKFVVSSYPNEDGTGCNIDLEKDDE